MCKFRFQLLDRAYLKERCADIPLGSDVTVMSRVARDGVNTYTVAEGHYGADETDNVAYGVREDLLSDRPPFETLYAIKTELYYRHKHRKNGNDIYTIKYVLGNLDTARVEFYCEVDRCITLTMDKFQYGRVSLYVPIIEEDGYVLDIAEENIDQKFFFERG